MNNLQPLEEEIMQLFWLLGKAFPKEIIAYLKAPVPPYNTVLSTIRKLEKEGYLTFRKFGKSHQYYPIIQREDASRSIFKKLYDKYLQRDKMELLSYFMEEEEMDADDLKKLIKTLKERSHE